jgi:hypothetical protein
MSKKSFLITVILTIIVGVTVFYSLPLEYQAVMLAIMVITIAFGSLFIIIISDFVKDWRRLK